MTFDQLRYFSVLAETLNYTRAADILFVSQPTLSRQIMLLEEEFQTKLFIRTYKAMHLSPAGEIFLSECRKLLLNYNQLRERMEEFRIGSQGTLTCASLGMHYPRLLELLRGFCLDNPDIHFVMKQVSTGQVAHKTLSGEADLGLGFSFEIGSEKDFEIIPLFNESFHIIMADSHPLAGRSSISIEELQNEHIILLGNNQFPFIKNLWEKLQISKAPHVTEIEDPGSINSILLNVQMGRYVSLIPSPMTHSVISGCVSAEIQDFDSTFHTVLLWKRQNDNPSLLLFQKYFYEHFSALKATNS